MQRPQTKANSSTKFLKITDFIKREAREKRIDAPAIYQMQKRLYSRREIAEHIHKPEQATVFLSKSNIAEMSDHLRFPI